MRSLLHRVTDLRPATAAAAVCGAVAVAAVALYYSTDYLREWTPHIADAAVTIGLTVTVVEAILRREAADRLRPRVDRVLRGIAVELRGYVDTILYDYAATHLDDTQDLPRDATVLVQRWLDERTTEDEPRHHADGELPTILVSARAFVQRLEQLRETDREVMSPDLVRAIDNFTGHVHQPIRLIEISRTIGWDGNEPTSLDTLMYGTQDFFAKFSRFDDTWVAINDTSIRGAQAQRELRVIVRDLRNAAS